jgi:hypothetical protein
MKPDRYTKIVLTVIAASLAWIAFHNTPGPAVVYAQAGPQRVQLVGLIGEVLGTASSPITIRVEPGLLSIPVRVETPIGSSAIPVQVQGQVGSPIPVRIQQ